MTELETLEEHWKQIAAEAREQWGNLSDDDLAKVGGRAERLAGLLQQKYGSTLEEASQSVRAFLEKYR